MTKFVTFHGEQWYYFFPMTCLLILIQGFNTDVILDGEDWIYNSVPFCFKFCLKLLIIAKDDVDATKMQLLKSLLKNARVLGEIKIFCFENLSADLKKQKEISNQLLHIGTASCVINFQSIFFCLVFLNSLLFVRSCRLLKTSKK